MKKNRTLVVIFALLLLLVSCGQKEESGSVEEPKEVAQEISAEQTQPKEEQPKEEQSKEAIEETIKEIQPTAPVVDVEPTAPVEETKPMDETEESSSDGTFSGLKEKIIKAEEKIKSMKTTGYLEIITDIKVMGEFAIINDIETIFVKEPFFVHTTTKSRRPEESSLPFFDVDLEAYQEETQMWIRSSVMGDTWVKMNAGDEDFESYDQYSYGQSPSSIYGENFDLFDVEKKGSDYLLKLTGDDEDWAEIIATILQNDPELQENQDEMKIHSLVMEILVDGSNYFPKEFRLDMEFTILGEEESDDVKIKQKADFSYSDYNAYSDMKVPKEVLNAAIN